MGIVCIVYFRVFLLSFSFRLQGTLFSRVSYLQDTLVIVLILAVSFSSLIGVGVQRWLDVLFPSSFPPSFPPPFNLFVQYHYFITEMVW